MNKEVDKINEWKQINESKKVDLDLEDGRLIW